MMVSHILKHVWWMKNGLILFCTPFLLLPLPLVIGTKEAACAYVVALMAVYWCTEVLPLAVTALLPAVLFPLFRIMESKDVCMQYLKDTNMLFLGGLMVAVAVEHWNLHKRIALRVLLIVGVRPALLMLGFMGVTAFLSMWISNTATTAMMVPIVQAVLEQLNRAEPDQVSTPEIDAKNTEKQPDTQVALNGPSFSMEFDMEEHSRNAEERIKMCKGLTLSVCYAASIGGTATLTGTGPNLVLMGQMSQLFPDNPDIINFASWFGFAFPNMIIMLILAWLWLQIVFLGVNFRKTWGCGTVKTEKEIAAYNVIKDEHRRLGPMTFGELSVLALFVLLVVLWFTRDPGFVDGWATQFFNAEKEFVTDATVAVFVAALLFVFPSKPPRLCHWRTQSSDTVLQQESGYTPTLLTWKVTQQKMPWSIILLLGGGFALAKGSESQSIGVNPLYVMIPCTLSASFAFMLPVATPPNAIVFSYGYLKVSDMAKTGIVMNIIGILSITLAINSWGKAIFSLDTFPSWANTTEV
ncbi:solute carrier family 13 member 5a isoform X2 [Carassius auratus]|uniref:Solute carrier family 13 member 5a isoform X2 n=1 Tax=Carassius auratus TaxID=7957 RepID=A0A6P6IUS4_CARAU|nr:solute carrier family 13 member 5-like isoform X2 [Carassius auratus]XP_052444136.1 solute carrier family 13 member 5a isoform X2 [Carassius gibelio]